MFFRLSFASVQGWEENAKCLLLLLQMLEGKGKSCTLACDEKERKKKRKKMVITAYTYVTLFSPSPYGTFLPCVRSYVYTKGDEFQMWENSRRSFSPPPPPPLLNTSHRCAPYIPMYWVVKLLFFRGSRGEWSELPILGHARRRFLPPSSRTRMRTNCGFSSLSLELEGEKNAPIS